VASFLAVEQQKPVLGMRGHVENLLFSGIFNCVKSIPNYKNAKEAAALLHWIGICTVADTDEDYCQK
jgi:hypothetical protein